MSRVPTTAEPTSLVELKEEQMMEHALVTVFHVKPVMQRQSVEELGSIPMVYGILKQ